ncbi:hypothetical protein [Gimesia sp.]|uniref:hypothetical protein n=1 Tax=Gimesia sp. TaxID=2024833 RepID=UPI0032ED4BB4
MKQRLRYFSWIIGVLGVLGVLLQSLQVQIEHTHSGGESAHQHSHSSGHSHSHGHSHTHGHGHSHSHGHGHAHSHSHAGHSHGHDHARGHGHSNHDQEEPATKIAQSPHKHMHIRLLWWEFTVQLPASPSEPSATEVAVARATSETSVQETDSLPDGLRFSAIPWERLISELVSSWMCVTPPERGRVPLRADCFANLNSAEACYQRLCDTPPVPPPQRLLSASFS